jgi:hypothetical protein
MLRIASAAALAALLLLVPSAPAGAPSQPTIPLPDEFRPEGIASGPKATFYVGSIPQGAVYRGSYVTGEGEVLVPPHPGRNHTGLKVDARHHRLFVSGGASKGIYVYDSQTGEDVASYSIPDAGFVNDVVLTKRAAYFTDSQVQRLYRVPIGRHGDLGELEIVPITGDFQYVEGFNANGIEALRSGRKLIVVQSGTGKLFAVDARSGDSREIPLTEPVPNGDGLLLRPTCGRTGGHTLYVVQNRLNQIAVVELGRKGGRVTGHLTSPDFDVPTTIAPFKRFIYAVNARFDLPDESDADVVRVRP